MKPKVSLIITNYNQGDNLSRCLRSALNQSFKDYEIIVVDNVFNSKTNKIIKEAPGANNRVRYVYKNLMAKITKRETGEKKARGQIILMTEADCLVSGNWIGEMIKPIAGEGYDAVQGFVDTKTNDFWNKQQQARLIKNFKGSNEAIGRINGKNFAIKTEALRSLKFTRSKYLSEADTELSVRFQKNGFKLKFLEDASVECYQQDSFAKIMDKYFCQGMCRLIKTDQRRRPFFGVIKSLTALDFGLAYFKFITGAAYRAGLIKGLCIKLGSKLNNFKMINFIYKAASAAIMKSQWLIPGFHKRYYPNMRVIGLDIITACNNSCFNCEASCRQAPSNEFMALKQIENFISESLEMRWEWAEIKLRGGEPTLHPNFFGVLEIIKKYKTKYPSCKIVLQTNGYGQRTREILAKIPGWIEVNSSEKTGITNSRFGSYNIAPIDLICYKLHHDFTKGCWRTEKCNIALTRYGYYPCSPGANADRVFGFDIGVKKLPLINDEIFRKQLDRLCRYCGFYKEPNEEIAEEKMSKSWKSSYEKYKINKPALHLF